MRIEHRELSKDSGWTRLDAVAVLAMMAVLATALLTAMGGGRTQAHIAGCIDSQRQFAFGWRSYAEDNADVVMSMGDSGFSDSTSWRVRPDFLSPPFPLANPGPDTAVKYDEAGYRLGKLYPYVQDVKAIHCPADYRWAKSNSPAYVSYSGVGNGASTASGVRNPAKRFLWIEENDPRSLMVNGRVIGENLGTWSFSSSGGNAWWDAPATFHVNSSVISYADGHVAVRQWVDNATLALAAYDPGALPADSMAPSKASVALEISTSSSPTGFPLYTDGRGSPRDLPFMMSGYEP